MKKGWFIITYVIAPIDVRFVSSLFVSTFEMKNKDKHTARQVTENFFSPEGTENSFH